MILVTGGTGLLGNCIVRELVKRGYSVRVLCRQASPVRALAGLPVDIVVGDLSDPRSIEHAVEGCAAVIHCAALIHLGWQRLAEAREVNVEGTRNVVVNCLKQRTKLIHVSTVDTLLAAKDPDHVISEEATLGIAKTPCTYVVTKTESERIVTAALDHGLEAMITHPGLMFSPFDWKPSSGRMLQQIFRAKILFAPPGGGSVCDTRDVADATCNMLEAWRTGRHYILGGDNLPYKELWERMLQVMGKRRPIVSLRRAAWPVSALMDLINRVARVREGEINGALLRMASLYHYYDSSRAATELGYKRRPLQQTLVESWGWMAENHPFSPVRAV